MLPLSRGTLSEELVQALGVGSAVPRPRDADDDEDRQLTLWILYELHYRGFPEVASSREWDPQLIALRSRLEESFEADLRTASLDARALAPDTGALSAQLAAIASYDDGAGLAHFLQRDATRDQFVEFVVQRSIYHLKEADPHAWALPRLRGPAKVALAELLYDEYGGGRSDRLHSRLFADGMRSIGLDPSYGRYVDLVPASTLAVNNAMSLFGINRRLRGAAMGHLAAFEMTSSLPSRRYLQGAQRLDLGPAVERYYDEHVEADAVHEHIASRSICGELVYDEPDLYDDVLFGAAACVHLDGVAANQMVDAWRSGRSSLLDIADQGVA